MSKCQKPKEKKKKKKYIKMPKLHKSAVFPCTCPLMISGAFNPIFNKNLFSSSFYLDIQESPLL